MTTWKRIILLSACVLGMVSIGRTETTLVIVTGEIPPTISAQPDQSFLTAVFQAIEQEMGVKFVFQFRPWKRCERAVEELKAWGTIPYIRTSEREKKFDFSDRLYSNAVKFFGYSAGGTKKTMFYTELSDLKPYKVGGVRGYWYENVFREAGIDLELVSNEAQNVKKLKNGRIDLAPFDETPGWYMIKGLFPEDWEKFFTLEKPLTVVDCYLMTAKQSPETQHLLNQFNVALKTIKDNGTFQQLMKKYGVKFIP